LQKTHLQHSTKNLGENQSFYKIEWQIILTTKIIKTKYTKIQNKIKFQPQSIIDLILVYQLFRLINIQYLMQINIILHSDFFGYYILKLLP